QAETHGIYVASVDDGTPRRGIPLNPIPLAQSVGSDDGTFRSAFSTSTTILAYRQSTSSRRQLLWLDPTGKVQGAFGQPDAQARSSPERAPDGQRVALIRVVDGNTDVWIIDSRGVASRFTFNPATESAPVWSPDGGCVVFRSTRNGVYDLFEKPANGAADE